MNAFLRHTRILAATTICYYEQEVASTFLYFIYRQYNCLLLISAAFPTKS